MVKQFIKRIIILNIIFALIMTIYRIIFTFYYFRWSELLPYFNDLIQAFILGVRYDCAILAYINSLVILCFVIFWFIGNQKLFVKFVRSLKYYYTIVLGEIYLLLCVNFVYYHYFNENINYLFFKVFEYKLSYLLQISKNEHILFCVLFLIFLIFICLTFFVLKYILEKEFEKEHLVKQNFFKKMVLSLIIILVEFIIAINIYLPISPLHNEYFEKQIVFCNGFFNLYKITIEKLKEKDWIKEFEYQNNIRKMFGDYLDTNISQIPRCKSETSIMKTTNYKNNIEEPNIILVIMESVAMDLVQYNSNEFNILGELKKHFDEDITFYNCLYSYAATTSSIEIILQSMLRVPKLANRKECHFIYSEFENIIDMYKLNDYNTTCISEDLYPVDFNNKIFNLKNDECEFEKIFDILNHSTKKQFIFVVTENNHHPFNIPYDYTPLEIKNSQIFDLSDAATLRHLQAHQYACQKAGEFLTKLKESKFVDNTIVVMVGDHCSRLKYSDDLIINKSVPLYLYIPEKLKPTKEKIDTTRVVSHLDIMPTLYELSLSSVTYYSIGQSVFSKDYQNAISSNYDDAIIVNGDDMCRYDIEKNKIESYKLKREKGKIVQYEQTKITEKHKKMIQQYKAGVAISEYILDVSKKENKNKE